MKWLTVALLWAVALLNYLDRQVIFSVFPLLRRDLNATDFQLGLVGTTFLVAYGTVSPFAGYIADRFGRVRVILASLLVWTAATWITGHIHSMPQLLTSRVLMGVSEAFYVPAALALIADWHTARTRSIATGLHQSGLYTGVVAGGAWGGWMADHSGWRPIFTILGITGTVYLVVLFFALGEKNGPAQTNRFGSSFRELLHASAFRPVIAAFTAISVANWLVYTWLPLFLYERFHMSMEGAGFSATFYTQAAGYAGVVVGGIASDRLSTRYPNARIYVLVIGLLIAAPFLVLLGVTGSRGLLILALLSFGFGRGIFDCNTMPVVRQVAPERLSATAYGILNLVSCIAGGIGAAAAGWFKQVIGLGTVFQLAAIVLVLGATGLLWHTRDAYFFQTRR